MRTAFKSTFFRRPTSTAVLWLFGTLQFLFASFSLAAPYDPANPGGPVVPMGPVEPIGSLDLMGPVDSTGPLVSMGPVVPAGPLEPMGPVDPGTGLDSHPLRFAQSTQSPDGFHRIVTRGVVLDNDTREPVADATIQVQGERGKVKTNASGEFELPPLIPRVYILSIEAEGYADKAVKLRLYEEGQRPMILLERGPSKVFEEKSVDVVSTVIEARPPVEHTLTMTELKQVPGSFNDAVRVVQNLPGVARSPIGLLIVRGTEPQDTGYYVDGIRVPLIFHFLGLHTVINTDILDQINFLPGNYGVRYGRTDGGVVDVAITEDVPFKWDGYVGLDLLNAQALLKVPIKENQGLMFSVRRGYIDFVLSHGLNAYERIRGEDVNVGIRQAPKYWDYQALYNYRINSRNFFHVLAFGAQDVFRIVAEPPASVPPELRGKNEAGADNGFHKVLARWRYSGDQLISQLTLSAGPDLQKYTFGGIDVTGTNWGLVLREDLNYRPQALPQLVLRTGLDFFSGFYKLDLNLPFDPYTTVSLDVGDELEPTLATIRGNYISPSFFVEAEYDFPKGIKIVPGLRVDPLFFPGEYSTIWFDPRLMVSWRAWKKTIFKGSVGRFGHIPPPFAIDPDFGGQADLLSPYSLQYSLGLEQTFTPFLSLDLTAFYSDRRRLVIIPSTPGAVDGRPDFTNDGSGRTRGLELLLRHTPYKGLFGWISYTLLKAELLDGLEPADEASCADPDFGGPCWHPSDYDQTHILTIVASYELPREWTLGLRFRYATGLPYTKLGYAIYDVDDNAYDPLPLHAGATNGERLPHFDDLTLRVDKKFKIKRIDIDGYLEVINVYNKKNPESISYNYNYKEEAYVYGLPIFPNLGLRMDF